MKKTKNNYMHNEFVDLLYKHLNVCGYTNAEVYKMAGMDANRFHGIISRGYIPEIDEVYALSKVLNLNENEYAELMNVAGYPLVAKLILNSSAV
ncbi:MAG: hypothetical protein E7172_05450 [Firmicutes bacterium]|nr:hypothetical protein [Bacillota bacterium]